MIHMRGIEKYYTAGSLRNYVLRQIDLEIEEGDFVTIMGPSGAGKSTLLHIMGLLDEPSGGEYAFLNQPVIQLKIAGGHYRSGGGQDDPGWWDRQTHVRAPFLRLWRIAADGQARTARGFPHHRGRGHGVASRPGERNLRARVLRRRRPASAAGAVECQSGFPRRAGDSPARGTGCRRRGWFGSDSPGRSRILRCAGGCRTSRTASIWEAGYSSCAGCRPWALRWWP